MFLFKILVITKVMKELKSSIIASLKGNHNEHFGVFTSNYFK